MTLRTTLFGAALAVLPLAASAATFQIDFSVNGSQGIIGTFDAPAGGGQVSNFVATISGVTFDTFLGSSFDYDPAQGDFVNYAPGFPQFTNSVAAPGLCGVGGCFLELYPNPGSVVPGDYLAIDALLNNIDDGTKYTILPAAVVPLPAGLPLLLGALGLVALVRRRAQD